MKKGILAGFVVLGLVAIWIATGGLGNGGKQGGGGGSPDSSASSGSGGSSSKGDPRDGATGVRERPVMTELYSADRYTEVQIMAREWIGRLSQPGDAAGREATLEEMRKALAGTDEVAVFAVLDALKGLRDATFDRGGFRELVEPHLATQNAQMRLGVWYALATLGPEPGDVERVMELVNDPEPELRQNAAELLNLFSKGDLTGPAGDAVVGLLDTREMDFRRNVLRGIGSASFSPALEASVIALSRSEQPLTQHDAVHYALGPQVNKSSATVARLIEILDDKALLNVAPLAAAGLKVGVPEESGGTVAEAAVNLLEGSESAQLQLIGMDLLWTHATVAHKAQIERLVADPNFDPRLRAGLQGILEGFEVTP